jgi:hypothetical protein
MHHTLIVLRGLNIFTELKAKYVYFGFCRDCYFCLARVTAHKKESHFSEPWVIQCHYLSRCLPLCLYSSLNLGRFFSFLNLYTVHKTPGRGISLSQGRYLHREQHKCRINGPRYPYLEWDSNLRLQCSRGRRRFMPYTARPLWRALCLNYHFRFKSHRTEVRYF